MNALKSDGSASPITTAAAERAPGLSIAVHTSLGEVVPVSAAPIPSIAYEQACDLAIKAGASAQKLKYSVGPDAKARGFSAWLEDDGPSQAGVKVVSGVAGLVALALGGCAYTIAGSISGAYAAIGGAAAIAFSAWTFTADKRNQRAVAHARSQRVESSQIAKVLVPFQASSEHIRAIAAKAVRAELSTIDSTLSAKAVETRDRALVTEGTSRETQRAARLTEAAAALLRKNADASLVRQSVDTIVACLTEATPTERREMAAALERCAFASEQPRFKVNDALDHERRLYRAIRAAANGEAPAD